jgi:hypothetical protein
MDSPLGEAGFEPQGVPGPDHSAFQQIYILEFDLLQSVLPKLVRFIKFKFQKTRLVIKKSFSSPYIEF